MLIFLQIRQNKFKAIDFKYPQKRSRIYSLYLWKIFLWLKISRKNFQQIVLSFIRCTGNIFFSVAIDHDLSSVGIAVF